MAKTIGTTFRFGKRFMAALKEAAAIDGVTATAFAREAITDKLRADAQWYAVPLEMLRGTFHEETEKETNEQAD